MSENESMNDAWPTPEENLLLWKVFGVWITSLMLMIGGVWLCIWAISNGHYLWGLFAVAGVFAVGWFRYAVAERVR